MDIRRTRYCPCLEGLAEWNDDDGRYAREIALPQGRRGIEADLEFLVPSLSFQTMFAEPARRRISCVCTPWLA